MTDEMTDETTGRDAPDAGAGRAASSEAGPGAAPTGAQGGPGGGEAPLGIEQARARLLEAAMMHVPFDGWSDVAFRAAIRDSGVSKTLAEAACPRGPVDLALAFHEAGDRAMVRRLNAEDLSGLRFRDRIATAVRYRIEAAEDREVVRRGSSLFALPQYATDGARAVWGTADRIWTTLGDTSNDLNWYTKRATLAAVYGSTVLYWLGDESEGSAETWAFLDRRIDDVMQVEKVKAQVEGNPVLKRLFAGPLWLSTRIKAPARPSEPDLPGHLSAAPPPAPSTAGSG
jgi:ubiquinone biosynthesis protein COQ9